MKYPVVTTLTALCLTLLSVTSVMAQQSSTGWRSDPEYRTFFEEELHGDLVPVLIEAHIFHGLLRFNAHFAPAPGGVQDWAQQHGLSDTQFAQANHDYLARGYRLHQHDRFNTDGFLANQAIWYRE